MRTASHTATLTAASASAKAPAKHATQHVTQRVTHYAQQQPTPDRYREIQQALADKGYFHGSPDGTWGPDSMDALKRFQTDQNLDADGKLSALSLIALGLGPRRENAAARPAPAASTPAPDSTAEPLPQPPPPAPGAVP